MGNIRFMSFSFPLSVVVPQQTLQYDKVILLRQLLMSIGATLNIGNSIWLLLCNRLKRMILGDRTKSKIKILFYNFYHYAQLSRIPR
jgi:hypothetical protein